MILTKLFDWLLGSGLAIGSLIAVNAMPVWAAEITQAEVAPTGVAQIEPPSDNQPETAIDRIQRTGVLTAGTRTDAVPFDFLDAEGNWVGYSIDIIRLIHQQLEQELGQTIQLQIVPISTDDWLFRVQQGEVDVACGSIGITPQRLREVDFSVPYFQTGTQFLVRRQAELAGNQFRVGVIRNTTNAVVARTFLRLAQFVEMPDRSSGLAALNRQQIDALASDGILLEGLRQTLDNPDAFAVLPDRPYNPELYGCALPSSDPLWAPLVNRAILGFLDDLLAGEPAALAIYEAWFGESGAAPADRDQLMEFFRQTVQAY